MRSLTLVEIDALLWAYKDGLLPVAEVPIALLGWLHEGVRQSVEAETADLQWQVNYWYLRAVAPEQHARLMEGIHADIAQGVAKSRQRERWAALDIAEKARQAALDGPVGVRSGQA